MPRALRAARVGDIGRSLEKGLDDPEFEELLRRIDGGGVIHHGNRLRLYFDGAEAIDAMIRAASEAEREVLVEAYIFEDDQTGHKVGAALVDAASRGLDVRVVADAWGSLTTRSSFWRELRRGGVRVRIYHPLVSHVWWQTFRDHRKLMVVDRKVAFTGGMNIGDEYASVHRWRRPRTHEMRDTHARIEGPAAWEMAAVFAESWEGAGGDPIAPSPMPRSDESDGARILVLESRHGRGNLEMAAAFAATVSAARERVWVTTAYFAPGGTGVRVFLDAARRGLDVRLLLPAITDVSIVRHAGHNSYGRLLRGGVRIFEYQPRVLHAKTLVADGKVTIVGSTNLDFRSFRLNSECNAVILDRDVGAAMMAQFESDLARSEEIKLDGWTRRNWFHRVGDRALAGLRPLL